MYRVLDNCTGSVPEFSLSTRYFPVTFVRRDGFQTVEVTVADELADFLDHWANQKKLGTRAAAVRDLLEWARAHVDDPDQQLLTRADLKELRDLVRGKK